jgi:hypothetical protein
LTLLIPSQIWHKIDQRVAAKVAAVRPSTIIPPRVPNELPEEKSVYLFFQILPGTRIISQRPNYVLQFLPFNNISNLLQRQQEATKRRNQRMKV